MATVEISKELTAGIAQLLADMERTYGKFKWKKMVVNTPNFIVTIEPRG